jgi:large subunit ribosomal protein L18
MINKEVIQRRLKIKASIRKKITGTAARPRLTVYRSLGNIYGQIIDDVAGKTLVAASSISKEVKSELTGAKSKKDKSAVVGKILAKNIKNVVFDRNGLLYHGRVKALADGAREGGLKF